MLIIVATEELSAEFRSSFLFVFFQSFFQTGILISILTSYQNRHLQLTRRWSTFSHQPSSKYKTLCRRIQLEMESLPHDSSSTGREHATAEQALERIAHRDSEDHVLKPGVDENPREGSSRVTSFRGYYSRQIRGDM